MFAGELIMTSPVSVIPLSVAVVDIRILPPVAVSCAGLLILRGPLDTSVTPSPAVTVAGPLTVVAPPAVRLRLPPTLRFACPVKVVGPPERSEERRVGNEG